MSRARILTLFLALIALASAFAACGGGGDSDSSQTIVDEATLQGIESGRIDLSIGIGIKGEKSGHIDADVTGPFQGKEKELPEFNITAGVRGAIGGEEISFNGGLALLGSKAYVGYENAEYEVDPTTFNIIKSMIKGQGGAQQGSSEAIACQEATSNLKIADFMENLSKGESIEVAGGVSTTKVSGDLNVSGALDAFSELIEDPTCREQLTAAGSLPSPAELDTAKNTVKDSVKDAHVDLYVADDHIVRRIVARATIEPPKGSDGRSVKSFKLDFDLELVGVNEDQTISAPTSSKPLSDLFLKLGINPIELLGAFEGQGAGGLGGLLEGLNSVGGSSSGGNGGGGQQAYLECLQGAHTATAIQNCVGMLQ